MNDTTILIDEWLVGIAVLMAIANIILPILFDIIADIADMVKQTMRRIKN